MKIRKFKNFILNEEINKDDNKNINLSEKEIKKLIEKEVKKVLPEGWDYEIELIPNKNKK